MQLPYAQSFTQRTWKIMWTSTSGNCPSRRCTSVVIRHSIQIRYPTSHERYQKCKTKHHINRSQPLVTQLFHLVLTCSSIYSPSSEFARLCYILLLSDHVGL